MDFLSTEEYEQETIRLALEGDHEAGREALVLCRTQLAARSLSPALSDYLAARLHDVLEGIKPDRIITSDDYRQAVLNALRINRPPVKPDNPFPDWELPLAAIAALMVHRGYRPTRVYEAMSDARQILETKDLAEKEARRIRDTYVVMQIKKGTDRVVADRAVVELMRIAGKCGEILKDYPTCN